MRITPKIFWVEKNHDLHQKTKRHDSRFFLQWTYAFHSHTLYLGAEQTPIPVYVMNFVPVPSRTRPWSLQ